jgi:hypothetical protein
MMQWMELLANPIVVITALVIGTIGEVVKRMIRAQAGDRGWRGVYYVTLPAHPVILGALIGLLPWLPIPEALTKEGYEFAGRLGTGIFAGIVCKVGYDSIISTVRRQLGQGEAREARATSVPSSPKAGEAARPAADGATGERP